MHPVQAAVLSYLHMPAHQSIATVTCHFHDSDLHTQEVDWEILLQLHLLFQSEYHAELHLSAEELD